MGLSTKVQTQASVPAVRCYSATNLRTAVTLELAEVLLRGIRYHPAAHRHLDKTHQRKPVFPQFFPYFCPPFYNPIILLCQLFRAFVKDMQSGQ